MLESLSLTEFPQSTNSRMNSLEHELQQYGYKPLPTNENALGSGFGLDVTMFRGNRPPCIDATPALDSTFTQDESVDAMQSVNSTILSQVDQSVHAISLHDQEPEECVKCQPLWYPWMLE